MKKVLLFFAGLFILLFTNCSDIDYGTGGPGSSRESLSINLSIPGSTINTYASIDATGGEDEVHTLYVLFFEPTSDGSGEFLEVHDISPKNDAVYKSGQTVELAIPDTSSLSNSKAYSLFFIANPDYYLEPHGGRAQNWSEVFRGKTENEVKQLRITIEGNEAAEGSAGYFDRKSYIQDNLLMTGSINKEAGDEMITAELTRIVSRFDIENAAGSKYTLVSASVWNAFPEQTIGDINFSDFSLERIKRLYGIKVKDNAVKGGLYAYENFVALPEQNDEVTTCLILGIRNEETQLTGYYRVNANAKGKPQQLRRNNAYTFKIISVNGNGDNSEEDAHNSDSNELNVQINEWNVDDQGCIVMDGDNILALSTNNIVFNRLGGDRDERIFTAGEGTLTIIDQYLPSGITAELKNGILYLHADESEINKSGYIEFQFGKLRATMYISQTGEVGQMLQVSHTSLPMFNFESPETSEVVKVTSSGPWTATIYNHDNGFVFANSTTEMKGDNQDTFTIETITDNTDMLARYAFVHVVLDENPQLSAVVIVSQNGVGGIELLPAHDAVVFDAEGGYTTPESDYTFTVSVEDPDIEWVAAIYGTHKNYFTATVSEDGTQVSVTANDRNPESMELSAELRVYLKDNPAIYKEVQITQQVHSLSVTPTTTATVSANGGSTEQFTVTSTADWVAEITVQGNEAYFNGIEDKISITGDPGTGNFYVTFPPVTTGGVTPEAVVTIRIPGTSIQETIIIRQSALQGKVINIQNYGTLYGYLTPENTYYRYNYIEQLWQSINSPEWFGANGTLFTGGVKFIDFNVTPNPDTDIYVLNGFTGDLSQGTSIRSWLNASENRVILALSDDRTNTLLTNLGLTAYTGSGGTGNNVVKTDFARTINTDATYTMDNNKLYEYLFKTGPFTVGESPIQKEDIKLLPYDASNNCLTKWPTTMIPLILDEHDKTRLLVGVDPSLRLIYVGEMDLFTTMGVSSISYTENGVAYTGKDNYYGGPHSEANLKFLNNLIAWMMEVVIKGDDFTNQFIQ